MIALSISLNTNMKTLSLTNQDSALKDWLLVQTIANFQKVLNLKSPEMISISI